MKQRFKRLRVNMLLYFMLFTTIIISCLWLIQMAFFEGYFQNKTIENMCNIGNKMKVCTVDTVEFASA